MTKPVRLTKLPGAHHRNLFTAQWRAPVTQDIQNTIWTLGRQPVTDQIYWNLIRPTETATLLEIIFPIA